jgi:hypothetical protein
MAHFTKEKLLCQVESEKERLEAAQGLPFRELLSATRITAALERAKVEYRNRIYGPAVTLWAFLSQVMTSKDPSCQNAVSRVLADRVVHGQKACSPDTSSYCEARGRLPEEVIRDLTRENGLELHRQAPSEWLWKGRRVQIVDGSTLTMADTPRNQEEYPQSSGQKVGLGFPILRFVVLLSLATGSVLECAIGSCKGKGTGELSLFRQVSKQLEAGEILLGDRLFDSYREIAELRARGVDCVFGKKSSRKCDFRRGRQLGPKDHIVVWKKPKYDSSRYDSKEQWESLPDAMEMREVSITVRRRGYRTRTVVIVTTLLDEKEYSAQDLMELFAERWNCELDLRSIKRALGMYHSRCESPEMVRKDLWTHLLAYNLIRVRMAQAASVSKVLPRRLSFTAARNHIENFAGHLAQASGSEHQRIEAEMLTAIANSRVPNRPGRKEPRVIKKRQQKYPYLTKPRDQARKGLTA